VGVSAPLLLGDGVGVTLIMVSSPNKTNHHNITEILLKVALNTIK
jgi:hypothetical protein